MPSQYRRPQIPYNPAEVLPFSNRYELTAEQNQPINSDQLDGDANYIIDAMNALYIFAAGIAAGVIPGATDITNVGKFPITDGAAPATITWTKITADYFAAQCIATAALQNGCVIEQILGNGAVSNAKILAGAIQDNNIEDNKISFDKITDIANAHFISFFNNQTAASLSGTKISAGSLPGNAIAPGALPGTAITAGSLPATALVNNSITRTQMALVLQTPIGTIIDWAGPGAAPSGYLKCNGQAVSRTVYLGLFGVCLTTFGPGDGVNTFNLPDLRGRSLFGVDPASVAPTGGRIVAHTTLASVDGEETHTLTIPEIPSHTHSYTAPNIGNPINTAPGGANINGGAGTTGSQGADGAHNNMPPYMLIQKIIYAGV